MSHYVLPDLPYDYSALEPHLSAKIVELHHGKHHAAYVKNANAVLDRLDAARQKEDLTSVASLERTLAFNLSGHVLHSIFWQNLMQKGGGEPQGALAEAWKHAYYLQYQNRKAEFFDAVGSLWNWKDVAGRFEAATRLDLHLAGAG